MLCWLSTDFILNNKIPGFLRLNSVQEDTQSILTLLLQMLAHDGFSTGMAQRGSGNRYSRRSRRPPWGSDAHTDACRTEQLAGWIQRERATQVQEAHSSRWGLGLRVSGDEYRESKGSLSNRAVSCHKANENGYPRTPHNVTLIQVSCSELH